MAEFTCYLKMYRQKMGLTQGQLAEKVGVRRETIMRLEKAQYNPSLKLAVDISRVLYRLKKYLCSNRGKISRPFEKAVEKLFLEGRFLSFGFF